MANRSCDQAVSYKIGVRLAQIQTFYRTNVRWRSPCCMAQTKQTAWKNTAGKPLAMGRGRGKKDPKPGRSADRKVVLEYSSDEDQPAEGAGAPQHVKKQIHLTLPTSPAHVTTTESFTAFFINHGLTQAMQKAFAKRGWSTDQMREFVTNFQKKHGQQVPMPKIYGDKDTSDSEGIELAVPVQVAVEAVHAMAAAPAQVAAV